MPRSSAITRLVNDPNPGVMNQRLTLSAPLVARDAVGSPSPHSYVEVETVWGGIVEILGGTYTTPREGQQRHTISTRARIRTHATLQDTWLVTHTPKGATVPRHYHIESMNFFGHGDEFQILQLRTWSTPTAPEITRATEDGDTRTTDDGQDRILEG